MQDIRYRAWDYVTEQYIDVGSGDYYLTPQGVLYKIIETDRETEQIMYIDMHADIQFYTGLKDENDKEIFEGDIVKTDRDELKVVKFIDSVFVLDKFDYEDDLLSYNRFVKVVGNIFENKDLLEK